MISSSTNLNTGEEKKLEIEKEVASEVVDTKFKWDEYKGNQPWKEQITVRGLVVSMVIGTMYSIIAMKLNLSAGIVPNFNVSAALLAFLLVRSWNKVIHKAGGFASYLLGLNRKTYELTGVGAEGNNPNTIRDPGFGWMTAFLFVVCFVGLFILIPLRKIMIVDLKLTFPSGLATAVLINGFHQQGEKVAKKQVSGFMKYFSISFLWGFFKWFFQGTQSCGFAQFPTFGLQAWKKTFYFDFNMTYVGAGMICPHLVNLSLLLGAVLSFGLIWPLIDFRKGQWFPNNLDESNMKGLYGYKVFLTVSLILGDGLYNFVKILVSSFLNVLQKINNRKNGKTSSHFLLLFYF
ncbi:unnamed protein product [Sphenostylis stenocarpa]|uniref:Uncharacterized protein n=1 Tax=Sphenostylis stenocarpa TaxID=92480 RepID=A0AA86T3M3_9FABA|nr:unnamed protein product [Sphenostylis stenocarpa]